MNLPFTSHLQDGVAINIPVLLFAATSGHFLTPKDKADNKEQLTILVVEDDPVNILAVSKLLEKCGYQVLAADNGQEAIELTKTTKFDLIFMDIEMPIMDGLQATKIIRSSSTFCCPANVPIVAMTGHTMRGDKDRFLKAGMDDFLSKPFYLKDLQLIITSLVR